MKTEQEQINKMAQVLCDDCRDNTAVGKPCKSSKGSYICESEKRKATALMQAGYGDISEYKAEIKRLKSEIGELKADLDHQIDATNDAENLASHLQDDYDKAFERLKAQEREIAKLKAENKQAKIDVLKELRERITKDRVANDTVVINVNYEIKELIKEVE